MAISWTVRNNEKMSNWNRWLEERQRQGQGAMKLSFICRKKSSVDKLTKDV